jgi:hypothetical protein
MRRTRRSGSTAGEALLLQLHIAGPQKGVGPFSRRRALGLRRPQPQAVHASSHAVAMSSALPPSDAHTDHWYAHAHDGFIVTARPCTGPGPCREAHQGQLRSACHEPSPGQSIRSPNA